MIVRIKIKNWDKYNPKRDQKNYTWLRLNNDFCSSPEFFSFSVTQKYIWVGVLCEASKKNSELLEAELDYLEHAIRVDAEDILLTLKALSKKGIIEFTTIGDRDGGRVHDNARSCSLPDAVVFTTPTNERTNVTDGRTVRTSRTDVTANSKEQTTQGKPKFQLETG